MHEPEPAAAEAEAAELVPAVEEPAVQKQDTDTVHPAEVDTSEAEEQPAAQEGWFDLFPVTSERMLIILQCSRGPVSPHIYLMA